MKYLSKELTKEIKARYDYLSELPPGERSLRARRVEEKAIGRMARVHSFRIENPGLGVPFCVPKNSGKRDIKKGEELLRGAFLWGRENFDPENFDESFIRELAYKIDPELYAPACIGMYRSVSARPTWVEVLPPTHYKVQEVEIPWLENSLKGMFQSEDIIDRLRTAIFAHFHISRIHPFIDGNGRTARIFQDVILDSVGLPPPVIDVGERQIYYQLLGQADCGWNQKKAEELGNGATKGESLFFNFMAGKVNSSLEKLICGSNGID